MNSKRRAELQRKLTLNAVPRPPAGLAERIKSDIPKYLKPEPQRTRFSSSMAFNLRVAASILLVVTSVFVAFEVLSPKRAPITRSKSAAAPQLTPTGMPMTASESDAATQTVSVEIAEAPAAATSAAAARELQAPAAPPARAPEAGANEGERRLAIAQSMEEVQVTTPAEPAAQMQVAEVPRPAAEDAVRMERVEAVAEPAPPPPPAAVPAPAPAPQAAAGKVRGTSFVREAYADTLTYDTRSIFGISVDASVFDRIKKTIESGARPAQRDVDIDALVNYFAGGPASPVRRDLVLEVEASPAPVEQDGDHAVLRFSVDTLRRDIDRGATTPPLAKDARIEIDVNPTAVASIERIGGAKIAPQPALVYNMSVTGLYALELRPGIQATQRIATVRLRYTPVATGREHVIEKTIHGHDLAKDWNRASRRHRLAALGAMWGEALRGTGGGSDVARRAEELATQNPGDERAQELAKAASATSGEP